MDASQKPPVSPKQPDLIPRPSTRHFTRPRPTSYSAATSPISTGHAQKHHALNTQGSGLVHVPKSGGLFPSHQKRIGSSADIVDLLKQRAGVIVGGAGISVALADGQENKRLVTWRGFLDVLAETVQKLLNLEASWLEEIRGYLAHAAQGPTPGSDLQIVAEMIAEKCSPDDPFMRYTHLVFKILSKLRATPHHPLAEALDKLGKLGDAPLFTTNYDCLLEDATGRFTLGLDDLLKVQRMARMNPHKYPAPIATHHVNYVFHLHGLFYDDPEHRFVLTNSEYFSSIDDFLISLKPILIDADLGATAAVEHHFPDVMTPEQLLQTRLAVESVTEETRGRAIVTSVSSVIKYDVEKADTHKLDKSDKSPRREQRNGRNSPSTRGGMSLSPRIPTVPAFHRSMVFLGVGGTLQDVHFTALWASLHEHNVYLVTSGRNLSYVKHFVLVKEDELESVMDFTFSDSLGREIESWEILCPIVYGKAFDDLMPFLQGVVRDLECALEAEKELGLDGLAISPRPENCGPLVSALDEMAE